eukprot:CAMPEP_0181021756 /NCGR_PEP_ID=MMETSP1070-20121207/1149_1 /TAXON_ID=265543 /ORGANISM="Minutocellus polymorphus, Strain NH13" /LENGTH=436 /DNA_ID=CAMNT_0023098649 /DNA_START=187 /DNA_END=1497 /DNA_ORIENTATION=-
MSSRKRSQASEALDGTVILGGGIAGLSTAAALRSIAGVQNLHILEKLDEASFANDRSGAAAQLGPNGLKALRAIGGDELASEVVNAGTKLVGNTMLLPNLPEPMTIADTAEADTGLPQVLMRWGVLRQLLSDRVPSNCMSHGVGHDVLGYNTQDDGGVRLVQADGSEVGPPSAPLIIAADGIYSSFRQCLATDSCALDAIDDRTAGIKYNQRVNIKAVTEGVLDEDQYMSNHTYSFFSPDGGVACFAGPAGEGYTYWAISVADSASSGDETESVKCEVVELVKCKKSAQQKKELIKQALLDKLRGLNEPLADFAVEKIEDTHPDYMYIQHSEEAEEIGPCLVSADGNVVLVGDAGHSMAPSYGQAANFALEDAASLAVCIRDADDVTLALQAYEHSRLERCREMQRRSADRAAKAMKGENAEDVSKWIFAWDVPGK